MIFKSSLKQLPGWAQPEHPILRYTLSRRQGRLSTRRRALQWLGQLLILGLVILLGYQLATDFGGRPLTSLHDALYWPLVFIGVLTGLAAMSLTGNVISVEKARGTWDSLRLTSYGPTLAFYTRWVSVFYTLRGPLAFLILGRLALVVGILIDLAQYFRGRYLDLLLSGITPAVPLPVGAVLLAALLTAGLLLPLVTVALDAAVGLLIAVVVRSPRYALFLRGVAGLVRIGVVLVALNLGDQVYGNMLGITTPAGMWGGALAHAVLGDQGLRLLNLENSSLFWVEQPYGVFIGVILLAVTLALAWLANALVAWTARLAERAE